MATDELGLDWFVKRAPEHLGPPLAPGEASRLSMEASVGRVADPSSPDLGSQGSLRLHGEGVVNHAAELSHVGAIATRWQKAVSAIGAALQDVRSLRGSLPADIQQKTALILRASPAVGSILLSIAPKNSGAVRDQSGDERPESDLPERTLADEATDVLISLLESVANSQLHEVDVVSDRLRDLGPRVGGSLNQLAQALLRSDITLDASWQEPYQTPQRVQITPSQADWIRSFVDGRGLDREEELETVIAVLRTVSDTERWLVQVDDNLEKMDASELDSGSYASRHVGERVSLEIRSTIREQPDGTTRRSSTILRVTSLAP